MEEYLPKMEEINIHIDECFDLEDKDRKIS
jgi:5-methylcytosine-specific restriction endonuclease McrBC GTP-binding regulatory subunit McrB